MKTLEAVKSFVDFDSKKKTGIYSIINLQETAKQNIKELEQEMKELGELEREQYLFLAGKRHMYVEFFGINGDAACK